MELPELIAAVFLKASLIGMLRSIESGFVAFAIFIIFLVVSAYPFAILPLLPPHPIQNDISNTLGDLLAAEEVCRDDSKLSTLAAIRRPAPDFPLDEALEQYLGTPVTYTLRLARIDVELRAVLHEREPVNYAHGKKRQNMSRRRRDRALEAVPGGIKHITLLEKVVWWWNEPQAVDNGSCRRCGQVHSVRYATLEDGEEQLETDWMEELHKFEKNILQLCFRIGVEVKKFASAKECIKKLREHTMKQRRELEPLFQDRARLIQELDETKKINAALQVRRSIEQLTLKYSTIRTVNGTDTTSAWKQLWNEVWNIAARDTTNPLHGLSQTNRYELRNAKEKGEQLFADMSAEIHQYDSNTKQDYKYFHPSMQAIVDKLQPTPDPGTGEVDWLKQLAELGILARRNGSV